MIKKHLPFVAGMLLAASVAHTTQYGHIPDQIAVATSDLVIVGKVARDDANAVDRQNPHAPSGPKIPMRACKVAVGEVIFDRVSWESPGAKRQVPQKGDVLTVVLEEGELLESGFEPKVGTEYVLVLKRMPDGDDWYVSVHPAYRREATPEVVATLKKAADLDKWDWGEATDGLRLALVVGEIRPYRTKEGQIVPAMIAVRNMSKQTVFLNCKPEDEPLSARGVAADGTTVTVPLRRSAGTTDADKDTFRKIASGQMGFITPYGARDEYHNFYLPLPAGKAKLQAIYESKREGYVKENPEHKGGPNLWMGKLSSAEVDIELPTPKNMASDQGMEVEAKSLRAAQTLAVQKGKQLEDAKAAFQDQLRRAETKGTITGRFAITQPTGSHFRASIEVLASDGRVEVDRVAFGEAGGWTHTNKTAEFKVEGVPLRPGVNYRIVVRAATCPITHVFKPTPKSDVEGYCEPRDCKGVLVTGKNMVLSRIPVAFGNQTTADLGEIAVEKVGWSLAVAAPAAAVRARVLYGAGEKEQKAEVEDWVARGLADAGSPITGSYTGWIDLSDKEQELYASMQGGRLIKGRANLMGGLYEVGIAGFKIGPRQIELKPGERKVVRLTDYTPPGNVFLALEASAGAGPDNRSAAPAIPRERAEAIALDAVMAYLQADPDSDRRLKDLSEAKLVQTPHGAYWRAGYAGPKPGTKSNCFLEVRVDTVTGHVVIRPAPGLKGA